MDWHALPQWIRDTSAVPKTKILQTLRQHHLRRSFRNRTVLNQYLTNLQWPWDMKWRPEQRAVIDTIFQGSKETVIQAVFGSGKTTMMIAVIHIMLLRQMQEARHIQVIAFNVAIKNEIRKKIANPTVNVCTYDSLIYRICAELNYENLHLPNFDGKRRFVREHLSEIKPKTTIRYVFVDECQDLEKSTYAILRRFFPAAAFVFVGDIFQSIQKEPRESLLWHLLQHPCLTRKVLTMTTTPRVPRPILQEIRLALGAYYPEFRETIMSWTSDNPMETHTKITWVPFASYKQVYDDLLTFCRSHQASEIMILTFSSAITVRGTLGDVARVRKFLATHNLLTNSNHKQMMDDRIFLSTANSSKGLERPHVFCFLSFPLEKAFANFSDDLVMNIITVALTRAQQSVVMYVPAHMDRFSTSLRMYKDCPRPTIDGEFQPAKMKTPFEGLRKGWSMLMQEHGITELLRQNILTFETKERLRSMAKRYRSTPIPSVRIDKFRTEEGSAFVGLLFESLILTTWTRSWLKGHCCEDVPQHAVFHYFSSSVANLRQEYHHYTHSHPCNPGTLFDGCVLYSRLQLATHQKLFHQISKEDAGILRAAWEPLVPSVLQLRPPTSSSCQLKIQCNVAMQFVTGIADAMLVPTGKTSANLLEVIEIKASRSPDWMQNALIQSILYGILLGRSRFRIHLLNVSSTEACSYFYHLPTQLMEMRHMVQTDVAIWNLNCFLAKNVTHHDPHKPTLNTDGLFFVQSNHQDADDNAAAAAAAITYACGEWMSPSRFYLHSQCLTREDLCKKLLSNDSARLIIGRSTPPCAWPVKCTTLQFAERNRTESLHIQWQRYLKDLAYPDDGHWQCPISKLCIQIGDLCQQFNFA